MAGQKPELYKRQRLERRLWLFEHICLPGIASQTDRDFRLIVLTGDGLPRFARKRLEAMIAPVPQVVLHIEPDRLPHIETCARVLHSFRDPAIPFTAEFSMDDDDCLARGFIAEIRRLFPPLMPLVETENHVELDFCRGFAGRLSDGEMQIKHVLAPHWGLAQTFLHRSSAALTAFNFHHYRFWRRNTAVSVTREPMFLRTFHDFNDSDTAWAKLKPEAFRPREGGIDQALAQGFDLAPPGIAIRTLG